MSFLLGLIMATVVQAPLEREVLFTGASGMELRGTYSVPKGLDGKKVPGVVLLPGSGPTDRNGNQPPTLITDLLKEISKTLNANGIATLRFDKRSAHVYMARFQQMKTSQYSEFFKWENFVGDAKAALKYLGTQSEVDPKRLAILGHSEGAEIAFQVAYDLAKVNEEPVAVVSIGGAGRPMGPILHEQIERALDRQSQPAPIKKKYLDFVDKACAQLAKEGTLPGDVPTGLGVLFNVTVTKLMHSYCSINPTDLAKGYPGPVLLINGSNDTQISPERDTPRLKTALESRSKGTVEVLIAPNASHNLKETTAGDSDVFKGPVVPVALEKIKKFLVSQLKP